MSPIPPLASANAFASFSVNDLAVAKQFYGETLGLDVREVESMGLELSLAGVRAFLYQKDTHQPATFTVLNFSVTNIDEAVAALIEQGVNFERYDGFGQDEQGIARGLTSGQGPDIAWFKDPAGNVLAVLQEK